AHALPIGGQGLDFIEQDDAGIAGRVLWDGLLKQLGDFLLAAAKGRTRELVRIDLDEAGPGAFESARYLVREPPRQRGLAGSGLACEHDKSVHRHHLEGKL